MSREKDNTTATAAATTVQPLNGQPYASADVFQDLADDFAQGVSIWREVPQQFAQYVREVLPPHRGAGGLRQLRAGRNVCQAARRGVLRGGRRGRALFHEILRPAGVERGTARAARGAGEDGGRTGVNAVAAQRTETQERLQIAAELLVRWAAEAAARQRLRRWRRERQTRMEDERDEIV
jgi:hypothetical protein